LEQDGSLDSGTTKKVVEKLAISSERHDKTE